MFTAPRRLRLHHGNATPENWRCALHAGSVKVTESSPARPRRGRRPSRPHPQPWGRPPRGPCPFHLCAAPRTRPSVPGQRDGTGRKQTLASRRTGEGKTAFYDLWCCLQYSLVVAGKKLFSTTDGRVGAPRFLLDLGQNTDPLTAPFCASTRGWAQVPLSSGAGTPHPYFQGDAGTGFGITLASPVLSGSSRP